MTDERLSIMQVTKVAQGGGAERIASQLHAGLARRGHASWMATVRDRGDDPTVLTIPPRPPLTMASRMLLRGSRELGPAGSRPAPIRALKRTLRFAATPRHARAEREGREFFDFPGTAAIPDLAPEPLDVLHGHNLHGSYFDLRQLAPFSERLPVTLTLHDEWTFTGHCGYGIACERWRIGCGSCPDLTLYPAIKHDGTHENWLAKQAIYAASRLYVTTPSQWLMDRARASIIARGAAGWRVIPHGVDRSVFRPSDRAAARQRLDLPAGASILLFAANGVRKSPYKDYETVAAAVERAAASSTARPVLGLALGDDSPAVTFPNGELRFVPYRSDIAVVADYFAAADLYLHAARAENLPTTILEALSSGVPVVATAVGGIDEEVRSLATAPGRWSGAGSGPNGATGVLVAQGDAVGMAAAAAALLGDDALRATLSANAAADAAERFDLDIQLDRTIAWYHEIVADWQERQRAT